MENVKNNDEVQLVQRKGEIEVMREFMKIFKESAAVASM